MGLLENASTTPKLQGPSLKRLDQHLDHNQKAKKKRLQPRSKHLNIFLSPYEADKPFYE